MELEYGVRVKVGNFYYLKYAKSLSKKEMSVLRKADNVPEEIRKRQQRASLPYIKVSTVTGSWSVEFVVGTMMYDALDSLHVVVDDEGARQLYGTEKKNTEAVFVAMLADTTTVGDFEYQKAKQKLLSEYLDRAGRKLNEEQEAGKTEEELRQENEKAVEEAVGDEEIKSAILDMGNHIAKEEEKQDKRKEKL